jgi:hypothetical protein
MRATQKRKAAGDVSAPKTVPKSAPKTASKARRERARQIRNWLAFIRPHADRYESLPRGEQRKLIEKLVKTTGSSENTLRRYIAAARVLETHGIREFPAGSRRLPVAAIEAIERIGKKDPARGRNLFADVMTGMWSVQSLKDMLKEKPRRARRPNKDDKVPKLSRMDVIESLDDLAHTHTDWPGPTLTSFGEASKGRRFNLFAKTAAPRFVVMIAEDRRAAVFDEKGLAWAGGAARVTREFLQNIAMATAMFDYVVVACNMLTGEVQSLVADMPKGCCDRVAVLNGMLDF